MIKVVVVVVAMVVVSARAMTVTQAEEDSLPQELKPITTFGSWFDDRAVERLRSQHRHIKEIGDATDEDDTEELYIMARLRDPEITLLKTEPAEKEPLKKALKTQDTREALRSFMREHTQRRGEGDAAPDSPSNEFMEIYERELQHFLNNLGNMLKAEIGGVSIENQSEEKEGQKNTKAESNNVATP